MAHKLSKEFVDYRDAKGEKQQCGNCDMFRAPDSCTLVEGKIERDDVCDRWVKKSGKVRI